MKFNKLSEEIGRLEHELLEYGEEKAYLIQLKFAYIEMYQNREYEMMTHYYSHLMNMKKMKYGGGER